MKYGKQKSLIEIQFHGSHIGRRYSSLDSAAVALNLIREIALKTFMSMENGGEMLENHAAV